MATRPQTYDPAAPSGARTAMAPRLRMLRAVWGGTETLAAAGEEYLPPFPKESRQAWAHRHRMARLRRNMLRQAVERTTGRIFEVPVKMLPPSAGAEVPPAGKTFADDADQRGTSLDRIAKRMYSGALRHGLSYVFVDYPVVEAANLAEERALDPRPYLVWLEPEQVLRHFEDKDGRTTHLAWFDVTVEWDEALGEQVVTERIHERFPGRARTWVKRGTLPTLGVPVTEGGRPVETNWELEAGSERVVSQPRIMVHVLYAEREATGIGRTPLTEVADLTIEHWQIASDYRNILTQVMFPIMTATGVDTTKIASEAIGPDAILSSSKEQAKFGYLEHNGNAIKAGADDLIALEQRAEAYAGQLTAPSGDVKATQTAVSTAEASSYAKDLAQALQDVLVAVCDDAALWAGVDSLGRPEVNMDFAVDLPDTDQSTLDSARGRGDISRETYWRELQRRHTLSADFDPEAERRLLEDEVAEGMEREQEAMRFAAGLAADEGAGAPNPPRPEAE